MHPHAGCTKRYQLTGPKCYGSLGPCWLYIIQQGGIKYQHKLALLFIGQSSQGSLYTVGIIVVCFCDLCVLVYGVAYCFEAILIMNTWTHTFMYFDDILQSELLILASEIRLSSERPENKIEHIFRIYKFVRFIL